MKTAAVTIRVPALLKQKLALRAKKEHRSLSAQIEAELDAAMSDEITSVRREQVRILGRYPGPVPTDEDFEQVRSALSRRLKLRKTGG